MRFHRDSAWLIALGVIAACGDDATNLHDSETESAGMVGSAPGASTGPMAGSSSNDTETMMDGSGSSTGATLSTGDDANTTSSGSGRSTESTGEPGVGSSSTTGDDETTGGAAACKPDPLPTDECGNGALDPGEACDLQDLDDLGCDATCQITTTGAPVWTAVEPGLAFDVAIADSDDIVVGGFKNASDRDLWVAKYDTTGGLLWSVEWPGIFGNHDQVDAVAIDGQNNVIAVGTTDQLVGGGESNADAYMWIGKLDADGNELWTVEWDVPNVSGPKDVAVNGNDDIIVVDPSANGTLTKLDADGALVWEVPVPVAYSGAVAVDADGSIALTGQIPGADSVWVGKYDSLGAPLWDATFPDANDVSVSTGNDIAFDSAGNVIVAGQLAAAGSIELWVTKIAPDGCVSWTRTLGGPDLRIARDLAVDSQDRIVVAGSMHDKFTALVARFDADGDQEWSWIDADSGVYDAVIAVGVDSQDRPVSVGIRSGTFFLDNVLVQHEN